ncbi:MAG TPA: hypothetical protein VHD90_22240 [Phototrophicaceae bacterium]|nr:hypothetical protein [Phototrophicaceae bacterium]
MRLFTALVVALSTFAACLALFSRPVSAADGKYCVELTLPWQNSTGSSGTATVTFHDKIPTDATYSGTITVPPGETRTLEIHGFFSTTTSPFDVTPYSATLTYNIGDIALKLVDNSVCAGSTPIINDGRINAYDLGAPLAAYCADGGIALYDIDDAGHGSFAFSASLDQIHTALEQAISSGQNVLIGQGLGDSLYALPSNQLTLVGPDVKEPSKTYTFIAVPDVCG